MIARPLPPAEGLLANRARHPAGASRRGRLHGPPGDAHSPPYACTGTSRAASTRQSSKAKSASRRTPLRVGRRSQGGSRRSPAGRTVQPSLRPDRPRRWRPKSGRNRATLRSGPRPLDGVHSWRSPNLTFGRRRPWPRRKRPWRRHPLGPLDGLERRLASLLFHVKLHQGAGVEVERRHEPGRGYRRSSITASDTGLAPSFSLAASKRRPLGFGPVAGMISCSSSNTSPASTGYPRPSTGDRGGVPLGPGPVAAGDAHPGAHGGQPDRSRPADPADATGDQYGLAGHQRCETHR